MLGARRLRRTALAAVVACALSAACGDDGDDPVTELDDGDEAGGEVADEVADDELVVAAYEAMWLDLLAAGDPPDPEAAVLAEHATGDALSGFRSKMGELQSEGVAYRGTYEFDARATDVTATSAVVEDCGLDRTELVVIATGEVAEDSDDVRDGIVADLVLEDGAWKVERLRDAPEVCEP